MPTLSHPVTPPSTHDEPGSDRPLFFLPLSSQLTTVTAAKTDASYSTASNLAQQNISQIRTVVAYNGEEVAIKQYESALQEPVKVWTGGAEEVWALGTSGPSTL